MAKIQMKTPLVEMDGDEMTRILWQMIKDKLITPYVDLKTEYYDLGLLNRNATKDQVTVDAANANKKYGVGVKCATITPNKQRMEEYPQLTEMWKSPNGTIRSILDGTVFRTPICIPAIKPVVKNWEKPITIARHAYGDVYKSVDMYTTEPGTCTMTFKGDETGEEKTLVVQKVNGPAVWQGAHNKESSIRSFARSCFQYAIDTKQDLWFSTKDTIAKIYDGEFKKVFEEEFEKGGYKEQFEKLGITYFYTLIDDAVARVIRSKGGYIWACKNYDGDVMSDMVSTAFGSLAMMTSVLVSPDGNYEFEAAHRYQALLQAPEGREDLHQLHGHHLCLVRRLQKARRAGQSARAGRLRREAGGSLLRYPQRRHHDQGSGGSGGAGLRSQGRQLRGVPGRHRRASGCQAGLSKSRSEGKRPLNCKVI